MLFLLLLCTLTITACVGGKASAPKIITMQENSSSAMQESISSSSEQSVENFKMVEIGKQVWLAENLNIDVKNSVCYKNDPANCEKYGRLYDWHTAMKICPKGWHLPKNKEWDELFQYVDGSLSKYANTESYWPYSSYTVAGKYLKAKSGWAYNGNGTDKFGFAALPGGFGFSDGYFSNINELGYWWSASESSEEGSYYRFIDYYYDVARYNSGSKLFLLSVRCIRD